jgi:hypothetical protein
MQVVVRVGLQLSEEPFWDKAKGELRIKGQRHVAVDAQGLCDHLDLIAGTKVAEVIMNQHEFRQGKDDTANIRREKPDASIEQLVDLFANAEPLSGIGVVKVNPPKTAPGPVDLEISNPCLKRTTGAAKSFLFSYWCGIFSELFGKEFKIDQITYDEKENSMKCRIIPK